MWLIFFCALIIICIIFKYKIDALSNEVTNLKQSLQRIEQQVTLQNKWRQDEQSLHNDVVDQPIATNSIAQGHNVEQTAQPSFTTNNSTELNPPATHPDSSNISDTQTTINNLATAEQRLLDRFAVDQTTSVYPVASEHPVPTQHEPTSTLAEPDEQSTPVVTSLLRSLKSWFLGGNLVVRVGAIVLLMGVVLLLRLLSEYIETPISLKLTAIGVIGLVVAGLGLKLVKKRFTYGITLQGAGLSTAYLTTFFAYQVYHVIPSLPSFGLLGVLSIVTVALAVRQNAFPLALLAFSGAFLAPILTSDNSGSLTTLFSYYLVLNIAIAVIAHYRTWKVLNLLGATVTFGLAYYWGFSDELLRISPTFTTQRWSLVLITSLHWILYLFIAVRYAQQIIAYNHTLTDSNASTHTSFASQHDYFTKNQPRLNQALPQSLPQTLLFPIDTGLMFATPLLAFGLLGSLLQDIEHGLTLVSAIMALSYLGLGWVLAQRSRRYALLTEGMLALGFGFLALIIPLEFDAKWVAFGWSVQGFALVWFGRRSLRAWSVIFGLLLQALAIISLLDAISSYASDVSYLALSVSALGWMASMFMLRQNNAPMASNADNDQHLLPYVNSNSVIFNIVWQTPIFIKTLTLAGMVWALLTTALNLDNWVNLNKFTDSGVIATVLLINLIIYWVVNRYRHWHETSLFSHGLLGLFYVALLLVLPEYHELHYLSDDSSSHYSLFNLYGWSLYIVVLLVGLVVAQLWIKNWSDDHQVASSHPRHSAKHTVWSADSQPTLWLTTSILLIAEFAHYFLPRSEDTLTVIIVTICLIALSHGVQRKLSSLMPWFHWQRALIGSRYLFIPLLFIWVVVTNWYYDGVVWGLPYIPVLNLYDIALLLTLGYGLNLHYLKTANLYAPDALSIDHANKPFNSLLKLIGIIGFWVLSSIMVRTLHTYAGTPLWADGAWDSDKVQTSLTILWTLTALLATFISSRNNKRFWWFMGISLLGVVVLKLVLVDLSQTDAIWRVVSFIGAGSLILLIGYLAPLPPEAKTPEPSKASSE